MHWLIRPETGVLTAKKSYKSESREVQERLKGRGLGGTHMSEVYGYVPLCQPAPLFRLLAAPETHLFPPSVSSYASVFHFTAFLGPFLSDFSAPNILILAKICSQDPSCLAWKWFRERLCDHWFCT